jgi:hypothetical protein
LQCKLKVKFAPTAYMEDLYTIHGGFFQNGIFLICDESEVAERLENFYGLRGVYSGNPVVESVEVEYLKEEIVGDCNKD